MIEGIAGIDARRADWHERLTKIEAGPLTYCSSFPEVARRWSDWWQWAGDRPLLVLQTSKTSGGRRDKAFDLLDQPDEWIRVRRAQVQASYYAGEALPSVRVDIGPVSMAAFMGAPLHLAGEEQTSWQDPIIDAWETASPLRVDPDNAWFKRVLALLERVADDARGNYLVCLPDLTGALDAIANLRTPEKLCLDLFEHRGEVLAAAAQAVDAWEQVFSAMYDRILARGAGVTQWVTAWADVPVTVPTCDFNALIGPTDFREVCMPSLKEQARRAGLCVIHLDGPEAARHAETLAEDPDITAVQFTPGAGTPSALAKLPMFRMFQEHRVPLFIECPLDEARSLAQELDPRGVALRVGGVSGPAAADELVAWRDKAF